MIFKILLTASIILPSCSESSTAHGPDPSVVIDSTISATTLQVDNVTRSINKDTLAISKTIILCNKVYLQKFHESFLKDEDINAFGVTVIDRKTKKPVFGYFTKAMRNDTNFIYSRIYINGDTITRKEYHDFKISIGTDSTISKFVCKMDGMWFFKYQRYWDGQVVSKEIEPFKMGK